jgi:uncharacterized protein (TIGR03083 family)
MRIPGRIDVLPLLSPLHSKLMDLYGALRLEQWDAPTICRGWTVKDVASHLLDTDLRKLSAGRDGHRRQPPKPITDGHSLVDYLNELNESWVEATRRLSPAVLTEWQALSGPQVVTYWHGIDMNAQAPFPVGWAGEDTSQNWFDCAREYTERWHHQQQIRDAVGAEPLTGTRWLSPILATFVRALPVAYREIKAEPGTRIAFEFTGEGGSEWALERREQRWTLYQGRAERADAMVRTDGDTAWRIFTKGIEQRLASERTQVEGRSEFRRPFLRALAIMATRLEDEP